MTEEKAKKKSPLVKIISSLFIIVIVLVVAVVVLFGLFGDKAIKIGVEKGATAALGVNVTLDDVSLSVLNGKLNINELVVGNPEGYSSENLLSLGHGYVALKTSSLMSDMIEIEKIKLEKIEVTIEQKNLQLSNLKEVLDHLPKPEAKEETPKEEKPGKKLHIQELELNGIVVNTTPLPGTGKAGMIRIELAPIKMTDLGGDKELDVAQLSGIILKSITEGILKQGLDLLPTEMLGSIADGLGEQGKQLLKAGEGILKEGGNVGKELLDSGKDIGEEAKGLVEGLFKKKEKE